MLDCPTYIPHQGLLKKYKFYVRHNQKGKSNTEKKIQFSLKSKRNNVCIPLQTSRPFLTSSDVLNGGLENLSVKPPKSLHPSEGLKTTVDKSSWVWGLAEVGREEPARGTRRGKPDRQCCCNGFSR